jgi:UDP-N-acetylglucosamine diphosphorylase / glucose-1-phosphate thymidylyltransferase / UDP-N-acetylgalactosamine diphosphorylase / glucosamine-1-phosphate N-acetyltransferase / galactosamine-1-phosphate N-acetyltransferase
MSDLQLILYDDAIARSWFPFSLTRPAGELLFGTRTLRQRTEEIAQVKCVGHLSASGLSDFDEPGAPPVITSDDIGTECPRLYISSRAVLDWSAHLTQPEHTVVYRIGNETIGYYCAPDEPSPTDAQLLQSGAARAEEVSGTTLGHVWELMSRNAAQVQKDIGHLHKSTQSVVPGAVATIGNSRLVLGKDVTIEPGVVLDLASGPIWLDDGVTVRAFSRLAGPSYVAPQSQLLGGSFSAVSIGPQCKVHGEIEQTVVLGYSNKAHDGFLGHAYLGCWVNLGALTTNSDLKNNYGNVRLWTPDGEVDTGEMKIGCLLGDHVKTGIGTMLNTGTVAGPGSNLFGSAQPPKFVPPFSWGSGSDLSTYDLEKFLETAETAMSRRKVQLSEKQRRMLSGAWEAGRKMAGSK